MATVMKPGAQILKPDCLVQILILTQTGYVKSDSSLNSLPQFSSLLKGRDSNSVCFTTCFEDEGDLHKALE